MSTRTSFSVGNRKVGGESECFIIAEAGVSHFGNESEALRLVRVAARSGADAVKFQMFDPNALFSNATSEWRDRLSSRHLDQDAMLRVRQEAADLGILFMCTAHDEPSLNFVLEHLGPEALKIGSGECGNLKFVRAHLLAGMPTFISLGMHTDSEITRLVALLEEFPDVPSVLLYTVSLYPTLPSELDLGRIRELQLGTGYPIGYSDHTSGTLAVTAARALGAVAVEKHFTAKFAVANSQDWRCSVDAKGLRRMVTDLRNLDQMLMPSPSPAIREVLSRDWALKSWTFREDLPKGSVLRMDSLMAARPGTGIPIDESLELFLGRSLVTHVKAGDLLRPEHVGQEPYPRTRRS